MGVRLKPDGTPLAGDFLPSGPPGSALQSYTVDQSTFREVRLTGLDEDYFSGKHFDLYTMDNDTVKAISQTELWKVAPFWSVLMGCDQGFASSICWNLEPLTQA